jgi:hypothetical protein
VIELPPFFPLLPLRPPVNSLVPSWIWWKSGRDCRSGVDRCRISAGRWERFPIYQADFSRLAGDEISFRPRQVSSPTRFGSSPFAAEGKRSVTVRFPITKCSGPDRPRAPTPRIVSGPSGGSTTPGPYTVIECDQTNPPVDDVSLTSRGTALRWAHRDPISPPDRAQARISDSRGSPTLDRPKTLTSNKLFRV